MGWTKTVKLHNGIYMPTFGLDTENLEPGQQAYHFIQKALREGCTHIDTSADFGVEKDIAKAVIDSGIPRNELFITDEIPVTETNTQAAIHAAEVSLKRLGMDYVDLYLISWTGGKDINDPDNPTVIETWRAVENMYKQGTTHAIGILDFEPWQIEYLLQDVEIAPMVALNCIYPGRDTKELLRTLTEHRIQPSGYLPRNEHDLLTCNELNIFAEKYHTDVHGVILQYLRQKDILAVVRKTPDELSKTKFEFTEDEMKYLDVMRDYSPRPVE